MVEELFLQSAWDLLVLGQTMPKKLSDKTLAQASEILERLRLLAKRFIFTIGALAASFSRVLKRPFQSLSRRGFIFSFLKLSNSQTLKLSNSLPSFIPL
ncbi:MAG: hypothetical protein HY747_08845, partial [Elusimicrobia bacterium]|nr:hypothetical protein [Elusimicrobiota bacterium]